MGAKPLIRPQLADSSGSITNVTSGGHLDEQDLIGGGREARIVTSCSSTGSRSVMPGA